MFIKLLFQCNGCQKAKPYKLQSKSCTADKQANKTHRNSSLWVSLYRAWRFFSTPFVCLLAFNAILFISFNAKTIGIWTGSNGASVTELRLASKNSLQQPKLHSAQTTQTWIVILAPRNGTKSYRRSELSRISPSVICGLSHPGEHSFWFGTVSRPICITLPISLSRRWNSGLLHPSSNKWCLA